MNEITLSLKHCSVEILRRHILDNDLIHNDPSGEAELRTYELALRMICGAHGYEEITLTEDEATAYLKSLEADQADRSYHAKRD